MSPPEIESPAPHGCAGNGLFKFAEFNADKKYIKNRHADKVEIVSVNKNHETALEYAHAGIPIFPCSATPNKKKYDQTGYSTPLKSPLVSGNWLNAATTDVETINGWWSDNPDALIALPCKLVNLLVIDADYHGGGPDGISAFQSLINEQGGLPANTVIVRTQSGGMHYIFRQPEGLSLGNGEGRLPKGINVRGVGKGDGGYIIAPKTIWRDPEGSERSWTYDDVSPELQSVINGTLPVAPDWLIALLVPTKQNSIEQRTKSKFNYLNDDVSYPRSDAERLRITEALLEFNPDDYDDWFKVGAALHDSGHPWARDVWDEFSRGSSKYDPNIQNDKWISFGDHPNPARIATLIVTAQERRAVKQSKVEISFTKFEWENPSTISPREWLYGKHYIRGFTTATIAPAGVGKSRNAVAEAVAMSSGLDLLGSKPVKPLRIHYLNGEDPYVEIKKQVIAVHLHFNLPEDATGGRLSFDSGRQSPIKLTASDGKGFKIAIPVRDELINKIRQEKIDCLIIDPFVSVHSVSENDNNAIDTVTKEFNYIAEVTNCSIELVHHTRKLNGGVATADDGRGASSLLGTVRSLRVLNVMSADEAKSAGMSEDSRFYYFRLSGEKANLGPRIKANWFHIASIDLCNSNALYPEGDNVGVVEPWTFPSPMDGINADDVCRVLDRMGDRSYGEHWKSKDWLGVIVAETLGRDPKKEQTILNQIIKAWVNNGYLINGDEIVARKSRRRPVLRVGKRP